jgi:LTXXQ motif family protein
MEGAIRGRSIVAFRLLTVTPLCLPARSARLATKVTADTVIQLAQVSTPRNPAAAGATETKGETVEQRIANLREALKITTDQESKWNAIAQAMHENDSNINPLIAVNRKIPPQDMTARSPVRMSTA